MSELPPDRAGMDTEQRNPRTMKLHELSVEECIQTLQQEDRALLDAVEAARPTLTSFAEAVLPGFRDGGRLIYLGAGTSGRLGVLDASEAPPTFQVAPDRIIGLIAGGDRALRESSEGLEDDPQGAWPELDSLTLSSKDAVLGITAGGTTPYVLGALEHVSQFASPPTTGLLSCARIAMPPGVDHLIVAHTGPESLTGSTRMKAGTATKLILNTLSTTLMIGSGRVHENLMVDLRASNDKLVDRAARIVSELTALDRPEALSLLTSAGGQVKVAVLMHHKGIPRDSAEETLRRHDQHLGDALRGG